jgi:hypothetical protein
MNKDTVLILGAGASYPFGFPSGIGLVREILSLRSTTYNGCTSAINALGFSFSQIEQFQTELRLSGLNSIDAFLQRRQDYDKIGKSCIFYILFMKEIKSKPFFINGEEDYKNKNNWYRLIANSYNRILNNKIYILTYNYDRSLEYFLLQSIKSTYNKKLDEAKALIRNNIEIIHIHGSLGDILSVEEKSLKYGFDYSKKGRMRDLHQLFNSSLIQNIKIIHDNDIDKQDQLKKAKEIISQSKKIVFLGFGFDEVNLDRLNIPKVKDNSDKKIFGTVFELPKIKKDWINNYFKGKGWLDHRLNLENMENFEFLNNYNILS